MKVCIAALVALVLAHAWRTGNGMFLGSDRKNSNNSVEQAFEENYLKGLGMEVNRKHYSHMLSVSNPTQSEETIYSKVIVLPQDEINAKLLRLRKAYSHIDTRSNNNNNNSVTLLHTTDDNDIKPVIPHEHSVQVISTLS